jgi:hypothetical protein
MAVTLKNKQVGRSHAEFMLVLIGTLMQADELIWIFER